MSVREENLNVELASLLVERGLNAIAEVKLHVGKLRKSTLKMTKEDGIIHLYHLYCPNKK